MQRTERLTHRREGVPAGYWTNKNKPELMERLGEYEDTELSPEEVRAMKRTGNPDDAKFDSFLEEAKEALKGYEENCVNPQKYTSKMCFLAEFLAKADEKKTELSFAASQIKQVLSLAK